MRYKIIFHMTSGLQTSFTPFEQYKSSEDCKNDWLEKFNDFKKRNLSFIAIGRDIINIDKVQLITYEQYE